jgi:putative ABC transport system permease protein
LIQQFLFEGYAYDVGAALVGAILGVVVGLALVTRLASLINSAGFFEAKRHVELRSVVVAFCVGALVTFATVLVSCWQVSRLNVVAAIRDLGDLRQGGEGIGAAFAQPWADLRTARRRLGRRRVRSGLAALLVAPWHLIAASRAFISRGPLLLVAGYALLSLGLSTRSGFPFYLGLSLLAIGGAMLLRWAMGAFRVPDRIRDRIGYSLAGTALVIVWLLPADFFDADLHISIEMFVLCGLMLTMGGVWVVMWNLELLLAALTRLGGGLGRIAPILKVAVSYPNQHRFRMGMTVFMFSLVIFALMVQAVIISSFGGRSPDLNKEIGGYDVYGSISPSNPIDDVAARITADPNLVGRITAVGALAQIPVDLRRPADPNQPWQRGSVDVADEGYLASTTFTLRSRANGYDSDAQVWQTLRTQPGYAVVDSLILGFSSAGKTFAPTQIEMRDARTNAVIRLTVIGTLYESTGHYAPAAGVYTGRATLLAAHDAPPPNTVYLFRVAPGQGVHETALALGSAFLANGLDVKETRVEYDEGQALDVGIDNLLEGLMGLGVIVGVAALGVVATRSVVERRQEIGMLRAIGFRRRAVQASFLLESSIVAVLGTLIGAVLGLVLGHQVVAYFAKDDPGLPFVVPWTEVGATLVAVYLASLVTTFLPARQASRVYPAEALRYE